MLLLGLLAMVAMVGPDAAEPEGDASIYTPTSSKAPESTFDGDTVADAEDPPEDPPDEPPSEVDESQDKPAETSPRKRPFSRHGVGVRGGITVIPTWIFARWVEAHTNSLCRANFGDFAKDKGLLKTGGCNFYVGAEYTYRQSRVFDIVSSIGYQKIGAPEGMWLDAYDSTVASIGGNPLAGASYTEVDLHVMYIEVDFIARAPIVVRERVEFGLGGGAGVGLGILFGGVYETPIGAAPTGYIPGQGQQPSNSCNNVEDLADLNRCTPRWDPDEAADGAQPPTVSDPSPPNSSGRPFASCTSDECNMSDLDAFGYRRKMDEIPPVIPVLNLILSARVIIDDHYAITVNGGFNTGFYFGGSFGYFFGKK